MRHKTNEVISLKNIPTYESLQRFAQRYPALDPDALTASLTLLCVGNMLEEAYCAHFARHGLSHGRFRVLVMLLREYEAGIETVTPALLADKVGVTRATMTGLLDGLVADGLVARSEHAQDRRQKQIVLTNKGRRLVDRMMPDHCARVTALMGGLKATEMRTLVQLLNKVADGLPALRDP